MCLARRSGSEYLRGESGRQRGSFDLPHLRGLPCEAWISLKVPIIKGVMPTCLMFYFSKSPLVAALGVFSGCESG